MYREIPQLEVDDFKEEVGAVIQIPQFFLPPLTQVLLHLFLPTATNTRGGRA